jgi:hypothetical protein
MAPDQFGRTIVDARGFVNSMRDVTKALENAPDIMEMSRRWGLLIAPGRLGPNRKHPICALSEI